MPNVQELKNKRLLIIDDDVDLLMLLQRILQKEGYIVETAASLPEAEDILSFYTPKVVLLDININGDDGRRLCWKLKNTYSKALIKVIIISGYDYNTSRAVLFGADDCLPKPINLEYLLHQIKNFSSDSKENMIPFIPK
ncbi:MAG TPA: response regulator [Flavisolibacter sp.]|nr:response regulator [Flavisolibacter sp.]